MPNPTRPRSTGRAADGRFDGHNGHDAYDAPSRRDPVVALATRVIGGPAGSRLRIGRGGLVAVVQALTLLAASMMALGVLQKGYCVANGWSHPQQFWRACYSDIPVLYSSTPGLADGSLPYLDQAWDQPLLSGLAMWLLSWVVPPGATGLAGQQWVFLLWVAVALALVVLSSVALVSMMPARPWHAAHLAASPVLIALALVSVDLVGIAALIWGIWCWRSGRPVSAGVLFGLAITAQPIAGVVLIAVLLLAPRQHQVTAALRSLVAAAATVVALFAPFVLLNPAGALAPIRNWWLSSAGNGSPVLLPQLVGTPLSGAGTTLVSVIGWLTAIALGVWLTRPGAPHLSLIRLAAPMTVIVALTSPVLPVQVGLWLLPLIALSTIGWRDHLIWAAAEIIHFVAIWLYLGFGADAGRGLPPEAYALAVLLRTCAWLYLGWRIWLGEGPGVHFRPRSAGPAPAWPDSARSAPGPWPAAGSDPTPTAGAEPGQPPSDPPGSDASEPAQQTDADRALHDGRRE